MKLHLENLRREGYFISNDDAKFRFKELIHYPNALGYDEESGGYLVLHKGHQPGGIADEIIACLILKKYGYEVALLDESAATGIEPDAKVNGVYCDIILIFEGLPYHLTRQQLIDKKWAVKK